MLGTNKDGDVVAGYRAPMVTADGIILGFLLNYMSVWVRSDVEHIGFEWQMYLIGGCVFIGSACMIWVLFRILSVRKNSEPLASYRSTLRLFIFGITIAFLGVFSDMIMTFMVD